MSASPIPRGRHAPPLAVRRAAQRGRLFAAGARVFARGGYAEATAEAIARDAGMSKATFYEHFANKEECLLALFDSGREQTIAAIVAASAAAGTSHTARIRAGAHAFLATLAEHPDAAQTLLVEIIGAGPRAAARRDEVLQAFADLLDRENAQAAADGAAARLASPDDAYAVVGAVAELASRQIRLGRPARMEDLEPVIERLLTGVLLGER